MTSIESITLGVVIPAGSADDVADTVASVLAWTGPSRAIVVVDDTGRPATRELEAHPGVSVVPAPDSGPGKTGALYRKIATGYESLLSSYRCEVVLRLDADALVIGPEPEQDALRHFAEHPRAGVLGCYRFTTNGGRRSFHWPALKLALEAAAPTGRRGRLLRRHWRAARRHGYRAGHHALGGGCFLRPELVEAWRAAGLLRETGFDGSRLAEDHLYGLVTWAMGYEVAEFAPDPYPLAVSWRRLPATPQELVDRNKKVIHTARRCDGMDEASIRAWFAARRP